MAEFTSELLTTTGPPTHVAYIRFLHRWIEAGSGRIDDSGQIVVQLDRMTVDPDDFSGHIHLSPIGRQPTGEDFRECQRLVGVSGS